MSASGEVRFEKNLNSLHGPSLPWNGVFYKEWVESQVFTIKIDFRNMFASGEVKF